MKERSWLKAACKTADRRKEGGQSNQTSTDMKGLQAGLAQSEFKQPVLVKVRSSNLELFMETQVWRRLFFCIKGLCDASARQATHTLSLASW